MEAVAKTKYLKGSPQKARLVIDLVRGQNVAKALSILEFTNKRAAGPIAKCIRSAIANATYKAEQENIAIDPDDLWVKRCFVDMGPTKNRRRLRPAPQGRAYFERRHYCHITIELTSDAPEVEEFEGPSKEQKAKIEARKAKKAAEQKAFEDERNAASKATADAEKAEAAEAEAAEAAEAKAEEAETAEAEAVEAPAEDARVEENAEEAPEDAAADEAPAEEKAEEAPSEEKADEAPAEEAKADEAKEEEAAEETEDAPADEAADEEKQDKE